MINLKDKRFHSYKTQKNLLNLISFKSGLVKSPNTQKYIQTFINKFKQDGCQTELEKKS